MDGRRGNFVKLIIALALYTSGSAFSALTSGQLIVINGLANETSPGVTASGIGVQVSDSSGPCSLIKLVAYNGSLAVKWDSKKAHSATQCTGITSVAITPLKKTVNAVSTIIYDSTTATTVPAIEATGPIIYTAPTNIVGNLALLVTGTGVPASAQSVSGTQWGIGAASTPVFDSSNGALMTVGVPGGVGLAGFKAEQIARRLGY